MPNLYYFKITSRHMALHFLCIVFFLFVTSVFGEGITFTFANGQVTGSLPKYYEFDVMVAADGEGTRIGDTMVYINYNSAGFGERIADNGKITVSKGTLVQGGSDPFWYYTITNIADNKNYRVAITNTYNYPGYPEFGNALPTTPTQLIHVKIEINSQSESSGLSFQDSLMNDQQYESDNSTKYDPVTASDMDDSSLLGQTASVAEVRLIPTEFGLSQNYPNPFNPVTTISYQLPKDSQVSLCIYDVLGKEVRRLIQERMKAGYHEATWDGFDEGGRMASSGIYFVYMQVGSFRQVRKMTLLR